MRWRKQVADWKPWFAWHPISIGNEYIWLEWMERRFCGDYYEIRAQIKGQNP